MIRSIILRFSDYEAPTIDRHRRHVDVSGEVWWGWWAKEHEDKQIAVLTDVARILDHDSSLDIGLVNRKERDFYVARIVEIVFDPSGSRLPSPDPEMTPSYYQESAHPAWFRMTDIRAISEAGWNEKFANVELPAGDATLFSLQAVDTAFEVQPQFPEPDYEDTVGNAILHLSDCHWGDDHGFGTGVNVSPLPPSSMVDGIVKRVRELEASVGVIVVSGDLITQGKADTYSDIVEPELGRLCHELGLEREHVLIVPGNHDLPIVDPTPTRTYDHETRFRQFLRGFYGADIREIEAVRRFRTPAGWTLRFVLLNSARFRDQKTKEYGYVGRERSGPVLRQLLHDNGGRNAHELIGDKQLNVAVLHHHLLPGELLTVPDEDRPISLTVDAGQLVSDLQGADVHAVLHGHQHIPFIGSTSRLRRGEAAEEWLGITGRLYVVGAGSTGAAGARMSDEMRDNSFGLYVPEGETLRVRVERFTRLLDAQTYLETTLPLT